MQYFYQFIMTQSEFQTWKISIIEFTNLDRDSLHIYFGLTVFLVMRLILGLLVPLRFCGPIAWLAVAIIAIFGEVLDYTGTGNFFMILGIYVHLHDIINTIFWPTVLLLFGHVIFATNPKPVSKLNDQASPKESPVTEID